MDNHFFYDTIAQLRSVEEIILYDKVIEFTNEDETLVADFLQIEFERESLNYPFVTPNFDASAALWAAKTVYTACQMLLYREHKDTELTNYCLLITIKSLQKLYFRQICVCAFYHKYSLKLS